MSGQLPTYPSPNPTTVRVNVGLGEGWVGSCPDTDIDLKFLTGEGLLGGYTVNLSHTTKSKIVT